jgi:hypothetical protein
LYVVFIIYNKIKGKQDGPVVSNDLFAGGVARVTVWNPGSGGGWTGPRINLLVVGFLSHLHPFMPHGY